MNYQARPEPRRQAAPYLFEDAGVAGGATGIGGDVPEADQLAWRP